MNNCVQLSEPRPSKFQAPQIGTVPDSNKLHLHDGPIDLIIEARGPGRDVAYQAAITRFKSTLDELVSELEYLRKSQIKDHKFKFATAQRMQKAIEPFQRHFITPMAAVAGSVADEILSAMHMCGDLERVFINNGGDIAFHLSTGKSFRMAIAAPIPAKIVIREEDGLRGVATSGWRGRSQSLGIADSVSVVAKNCAMADAAATLITNAVNLPNNSRISRLPANELLPDSDLGARLVTTDVGNLTNVEIDRALNRGEKLAQDLIANGNIGGAYIVLKSEYRFIGPMELIETTDKILKEEREYG